MNILNTRGLKNEHKHPNIMNIRVLKDEHTKDGVELHRVSAVNTRHSTPDNNQCQRHTKRLHEVSFVNTR